MSFYDKQIQYLDLWEYGDKVGNAGFIKIDARDEECRVWISVKGVYPTDVIVGKLMLLGGGEHTLADQILLHQGMGTYAAKWEVGNLAQTGISYDMWEGIRIEISEQRYIEKVWAKREEYSVSEELVSMKPTQEKIVLEGPVEEKVEIERPTEEFIPVKPVLERSVEDRPPVSKWAMLGQYYKKKKPFEDEREYLCISPEDLILLPEKYEHLLKNSFLLHGYYAYGHLLLGAIDVQKRNMYRLYIPGMGHDKEQIVASMFGFGNFTPAKSVRPEKFATERKEGEFGYYYMTVEL